MKIEKRNIFWHLSTLLLSVCAGIISRTNNILALIIMIGIILHIVSGLWFIDKIKLDNVEIKK